MTHQYTITGLTCAGCVAKAKSALLKLGDVTEATVQLQAPQATVTMQKHIPVSALQSVLASAGPYTIAEADGGMHNTMTATETRTWLATYKPILLIGAFITGVAVLIELVHAPFNTMRWMQHFMAGFFLVFSFFKLLDVKGFADSYATYDVVAKSWRGWGFVYPFVELALGMAFLTGFHPLFTNSATFVVMSISSIGVLQSVMSRRKIRCACLGAVFNLPMSTVTLIEDGLMIVMSAVMLVTLL